MSFARETDQYVFSTKAVVAVLKGALLPCCSKAEREAHTKEFDTLLAYLSNEKVTDNPTKAPEHRRKLRNKHIDGLRELFPTLAQACDNVDSYDPSWFSNLVSQFGEKLDFIVAASETATNPPTADDYLQPQVVPGGDA